MRTMIPKLLLWAGVIGLSVISVTPREFLPPIGIHMWDKLQHVLAYAVLAAMGGLAYPAKKYLAVLFVGLIVLGGALEIAQAYVPNRDPGLGDAVANALGAAIGLFAERFLRKFQPDYLSRE